MTQPVVWDPVVTKVNLLDMQVCVPSTWTDEQVVAFANDREEAGTKQGWQIRRAGDPALNGDPERQTCSAREGMCHLVLDA